MFKNNSPMNILAGITFCIAIFNTFIGISNYNKNKESIQKQAKIEDKLNKIIDKK